MRALSDDVCGCCGREIGLPIKLTVLSGGPEETYSACPFCLTRVEAAKEEVVTAPVLEKKPERLRRKEKMEAVGPSVGGCGHHLGYLKGRAKNAAIPDECLVCPKILQCMI